MKASNLIVAAVVAALAAPALGEPIAQMDHGVSEQRINGMYSVTWTYQMPEGYSAEQIRQLFAKTAHIYVGVPGLIRKYFGHSDDLRTVVGIYIWETKAEADAFYSPEWIAGVVSRWGSMPDKTEWQLPQVVESIDGRVITSAN